MKKLTIILLVILAAGCSSQQGYTRYTPGMLKQDGQTVCPPYRRTAPIKRSTWKTLAKYEKPKHSSAVSFF